MCLCVCVCFVCFFEIKSDTIEITNTSRGLLPYTVAFEDYLRINMTFQAMATSELFTVIYNPSTNEITEVFAFARSRTASTNIAGYDTITDTQCGQVSFLSGRWKYSCPPPFSLCFFFFF